MAKSNYLAVNTLNHSLRGIAYASPPIVYLGVFTTAPTNAGGGIEVFGGSYIRQPVNFGAPGTPAVNQCTNTAVVLYAVASANWGTLIHFGVFDAPSAGNMLHHAPMNSPRIILIGDQFHVPIGQLVIGEA